MHSHQNKGSVTVLRYCIDLLYHLIKCVLAHYYEWLRGIDIVPMLIQIIMW